MDLEFYYFLRLMLLDYVYMGALHPLGGPKGAKSSGELCVKTFVHS